MSGPNIIFILTDQHLASTLGCYGSTVCRTPHLDALARDGLLFTRAYAACPICTPARASLQTGLLPIHHGMQTNIYTRGCQIHELPDHPTLLPRRLGALGYRAGFTGKWHLGFGPAAAEHPEHRHHITACPGLARIPLHGSLPSTIGYEGDDFPGHGGVGIHTPQYRSWLDARGKRLETRPVHDRYPRTYEVTSGADTTVNHFLTERALAHVGAYLDAGAPFYYQLNYWGPHADYHAPTEFLDLYRHADLPPWPSFAADQTRKPRVHSAHRAETTRPWTWENFRECLRMYYATITEIDAQIGRLVGELKRRGAYDDTLIVFSADHGDSLGIHRGLTDKALFMYEQTNRVPLVIKAPANRRIADGTPRFPRAGEQEDRFAGTCDLYSTFLDYAGLSRADAELDGRSLRPLIEHDPGLAWRDQIVTECSGLDFLLVTQRALRYLNYKYVFNGGDLEELYDLAADPHELDNLAPDPARAALLREMRLRLDRWLAENNDGLQERFRRICDLV